MSVFQSYNTLGQSPCAVGTYLQGACNHGGTLQVWGCLVHRTHPRKVFTLPDLVSDDYSYVGPTVPSDFSNLCKCNTVVYSLLSACDTCQGSNWFSCVCFLCPCTLTDTITVTLVCRWGTWAQNCTAVDPPQTFVLSITAPDLVPSPIVRLFYSCSDGLLRFSHTIPNGTRVPGWAFIDVTVSCAPSCRSFRAWGPTRNHRIIEGGNLGSCLGLSIWE